MKHIFIINPAAGKYDHSQQFRKQIEEACGARGLVYEICVSQKPGDCRDIARKAAESGEEVRLYACGVQKTPGSHPAVHAESRLRAFALS